ncbi:MAG TPA: hypothetical protein VEQ58_14395, partial [Polyangiaceae bacterium]|nr:hypothetical protein [Polyangiaceae bacterium]
MRVSKWAWFCLVHYGRTESTKQARRVWSPTRTQEAIMDLELAGKRAIVTGGSRGIGKVIA